jgi:hypothetical protein
MLISNTAGVVGVVLAVLLGYRLDAALPRTPGMEDLGICASALFLGAYGLTFDRCEVPGLLGSYRANLQNFFAAASEAGLGTYGKSLVPGRRMAFFFLPVFLAPLLPLAIGLCGVAYELVGHGTISPLDRFRYFDVPVSCVGVWIAYAWTTRGLRMRVRKGTRESVHWH